LLFNSHLFIFLFLPLVLCAFLQLEKRGWMTAALVWLTAASLTFYGWWNPRYLLLICGSILCNHLIGSQIIQRGGHKLLLVIGIVFNLALLGYFKYAGFLAENLHGMFAWPDDFGHVVLPLAISFFTFQQIAWLVDSHQGKAAAGGLLRYSLFVTFFPQLIAGPIVHHREMMPQFGLARAPSQRSIDLAAGLSIFCIGLGKKVLIADSLSVYVDPVFAAAAAGQTLSFIEAWGGTLAYTFQLYFDFSGYSDMAIGLARLFGIVIPINFYSPYKARNIAEFWQRWHITLSRFLKDYLYIPLGGNRRGLSRTQLNLLLTMLLGGLWHGAAWTFVLWGGIHGLYLMLHRLIGSVGWRVLPVQLSQWLGRLMTFVAVAMAWVIFRAESVPAAWRQLAAMLPWNASELPSGMLPLRWQQQLAELGFDSVKMPNFSGTEQCLWLATAALLAFAAPNTAQIMAHYKPGILPPGWQPLQTSQSPQLQWQPNRLWAIAIAIIATWAILSMYQAQEFLYFQF